MSETTKQLHKTGRAAGDIRTDKFDDLIIYKYTSKLSCYADEERRQFFREYISGPLYRRILYNRAPVISLVLSENQTQGNTDRIGLRSNFLPNFSTLFNTPEAFQLNTNTGLSSVNGFEKVLAACLLFGDSDYHLNNIGVIKKDDGEYTACKIDHGYSLTNFFSNESEARRKLLNGRGDHGYAHWNVSYDISKLKNAISEIINISQHEINTIIDNRYRDLIKAGFQLSGENTASFFKSSIHQNLEVMKELYKSLEIIEMIDGDEKFKSFGWLDEIQGQDPIIWAEKNNKTINGQNPYQWAIENNIPISGENPIIWMIKNNKDALKWAVDNNKTINGQNPYQYAIENNIPILGENPIIWMIKNEKNMLEPNTIEDFAAKHFSAKLISFFAKEKIKLDGQDPILWAEKNNLLVYKKPIINYAILNKLHIEGKPAQDWCAMHRPGAQINGQSLASYCKKWRLKILGKDAPEWEAERKIAHNTSEQTVVTALLAEDDLKQAKEAAQAAFSPAQNPHPKQVEGERRTTPPSPRSSQR